METVEGWRNVPARWQGGSLAIGNFDGVHQGHRAVLRAAKAAAAELGASMGAMVFEPYPRTYFQPGKPFFRLTPLPRKLELLASYGCDFVAVIPFGEEVAGMTDEIFVQDVLAGGYAVRHVAVGFNFLYGKGRSGTPETLRHSGQKLGFEVTVLMPTGGAGEIYSSTRIRELLAEGDVGGAAEILGYPWRVSGVVESGAGRGTGLGFPTANIRLDQGVGLRHGIYAVLVQLPGRIVRGAAYLGTRPTFDHGPPLLETFLFDFDANLYGAEIAIDFIAFVREDAKFRSGEALAAQMALDCQRAADLLSAYQPPTASHA